MLVKLFVNVLLVDTYFSVSHKTSRQAEHMVCISLSLSLSLSLSIYIYIYIYMWSNNSTTVLTFLGPALTRGVDWTKLFPPSKLIAR